MYWWWSKDTNENSATESKCKFSDLKWDTLNVRHRYRTWEITYNKISEAFLHDLLRLPWFKWWLQKLRNKFIRPVNPDYRMELLKLIYDMHSKQLNITIRDLLIQKHGPAIRLSNEYYKHYKNLQLIIDSLEASGDIQTKNGITPTPIAVSTIANYNEGIMRHQDIVKLTKRQLFLGWGMFAVAAVTLFIEISKWLK